MNRRAFLFLGLLAFSVCVFAAEGQQDPELDPTIQERLDQAKVRDDIEKKYREGVRKAQKPFVDRMIKKHKDEMKQDELDQEDDRRKDLSPEEIERKKASRRWADKISKDETLKTVPATPLKYKEIKVGNGHGIGPAINRVMNLEIRGVDGKVYMKKENYEITANALRGTGFLNAIARAQSVGDHWEVYVPYELGYGEKGQRGRNIPAFMGLIVDVEVVSSDVEHDVAAKRPDL